MHLDFADTVPLAVFAPAAFDVKRKSARFVPSHSGSGKLREEHANLVKNLDVGDRVIDLGPDGGPAGGEILAEGTPETVSGIRNSDTGKYLKSILPARRRTKTVRAV